MASPVNKITLLVPGFANTTRWGTIQCFSEYSDHPEPWQAQLSALLALSDWDARHLPAAELARSTQKQKFVNAGLAENSPLVCADPIHLRAGRDSATLLPPEVLALTADEADALLVALNDFLQEDDLHIVQLEPGRWYMSGRNAEGLDAYPPSFLAYRNASAFLSEGDASRDWRKLMSELQMLLHTHPINVEREQKGLLPVNGVWFWGGASLAIAKRERAAATTSAKGHESVMTGVGGVQGARVSGAAEEEGGNATTVVEAVTDAQGWRVELFADEGYAVALAMQLGIPCRPLDEFKPRVNKIISGDCDPDRTQRHIIVIDTRLMQAIFASNEIAMEAAEACICRQWLAPLQSCVESGGALELAILNEDGEQGFLNAQTVQQFVLSPGEGIENEVSGPQYSICTLAGYAVLGRLGSRLQQVNKLWRKLTGRG